MVVPNNHGFSDHFGMFWGYHHLRKHPYIYIFKFKYIYIYIHMVPLHVLLSNSPCWRRPDVRWLDVDDDDDDDDDGGGGGGGDGDIGCSCWWGWEWVHLQSIQDYTTPLTIYKPIANLSWEHQTPDDRFYAITYCCTSKRPADVDAGSFQRLIYWIMRMVLILAPARWIHVNIQVSSSLSNYRVSNLVCFQTSQPSSSMEFPHFLLEFCRMVVCEFPMMNFASTSTICWVATRPRVGGDLGIHSSIIVQALFLEEKRQHMLPTPQVHCCLMEQTTKCYVDGQINDTQVLETTAGNEIVLQCCLLKLATVLFVFTWVCLHIWLIYVHSCSCNVYSI